MCVAISQKLFCSYKIDFNVNIEAFDIKITLLKKRIIEKIKIFWASKIIQKKTERRSFFLRCRITHVLKNISKYLAFLKNDKKSQMTLALYN